MLNISNLTKSFGDVKAVYDVCFEVPKNAITALVGPNGAGKTTVFHLVSGLIEAEAGSMLFDGHELKGLPAWRRARLGISRTFQLARLFKNLSIEENLLLALRCDDDQFVRMWLRGASQDAQEKKTVHEMLAFVGLEKNPQAPVMELSYGQQKLFDLARALLNPHTFLMLDEPVAGVNPVLREQFKTLLKQLQEKGETILLIEHDMDFVRAVVQHVIVMDQGAVLAKGTPESIFKNTVVLDAYLGSL